MGESYEQKHWLLQKSSKRLAIFIEKTFFFAKLVVGRGGTDTPTDALMVWGVGEERGCLVVWEEGRREEGLGRRFGEGSWRINRL